MIVILSDGRSLKRATAIEGPAFRAEVPPFTASSASSR